MSQLRVHMFPYPVGDFPPKKAPIASHTTHDPINDTDGKLIPGKDDEGFPQQNCLCNDSAKACYENSKIK
jgi:hypothetical protein